LDEVDITDKASVGDAVGRLKPDLIINAAAYTQVDMAESEPEIAWQVNAVGAEIVAAHAHKAGVPVVHVSTDYVFDGTKARPYLEDDPVAPIGAYARSKAAGEAAVRRVAPRHVILRTAWLYSPHGRNFAKTVMRLAAEQRELRIVADQFGSPTAAGDLARAILGIVPHLLQRAAPCGTFHLAGEGVATWFDFARQIVDERAKVIGCRADVVPIATAEYPTAARRPRYSALDSTRFFDTFGIRLGPWQAAVGPNVAAILAAEVVA
jgi:dTDP-4-dehydrorhamnose reductase